MLLLRLAAYLVLSLTVVSAQSTKLFKETPQQPIAQMVNHPVASSSVGCKPVLSPPLGAYFYTGAQVQPAFVIHNWTETAMVVFEECRYSDIGSAVIRFVRVGIHPPFSPTAISEHVWDGFVAVQSPAIAYTGDQQQLVVIFSAILPNRTTWSLVILRSSNHGKDWTPYQVLEYPGDPVRPYGNSLFSPLPNFILLFSQTDKGGHIGAIASNGYYWWINHQGERFQIGTERSPISWAAFELNGRYDKVYIYNGPSVLNSAFTPFLWPVREFRPLENTPVSMGAAICSSLPDQEHALLPHVKNRQGCGDRNWTMRRGLDALRIIPDRLTGFLHGVGSREVAGEPRLVRSRTCEVDNVYCGPKVAALLNLSGMKPEHECDPSALSRESDCTYLETSYNKACLVWAPSIESYQFEPGCVDIESDPQPTVAMGIAVNNQSIIAVVYYKTKKDLASADFMVETKLVFFSKQTRLLDFTFRTFDARKLPYSEGYFSSDSIPIRADGADFVMVYPAELCSLLEEGNCRDSSPRSQQKEGVTIVDISGPRTGVYIARLRVSPPWYGKTG